MTSSTPYEEHIIHAVNILYYGEEIQSDLPDLLDLAEKDPEWAQSHASTKYTVNAVERAKEDGKVAALRYLYNEFMEVTEEYTRWHFLSVVETNDIEVLAGLNQRRTAIIRGMSFLDQYFKANLSIDPDDRVSLARLIDDSKRDNVITKEEQKILQFVRELRNDVAHYSWLDPKFDDRLLHLSVEALLYVVGNVMVREHAQHKELEDDPAKDFEPQELINHLERESGWVYDERDKRWFIS